MCLGKLGGGGGGKPSQGRQCFVESTVVQMVHSSEEWTLLKCDWHTSSVFATLAWSETTTFQPVYQLLHSDQELHIFWLLWRIWLF